MEKGGGKGVLRGKRTSRSVGMGDELANLSSMLGVQVPALFSFCILRTAFVFLASRVVSCLGRLVRLPKYLCGVHAMCAKTGRRVRDGALVAGGVWLLCLVVWEPIKVCAELRHPRIQGLACATGLVAITTCNRFLASALSLATLLAVRQASEASIVLALASTTAVLVRSWNHVAIGAAAFLVAVLCAHLIACGASDAVVVGTGATAARAAVASLDLALRFFIGHKRDATQYEMRRGLHER